LRLSGLKAGQARGVARVFNVLSLQSLLGLAVIIAVCWLMSENRKAFPWRLTLGAMAVQAGLVLLVFGLPGSRLVLGAITGTVDALDAATQEGTRFIFGYLVGTGPQPYQMTSDSIFVFAFQVLPLILVISALSALLWHWKILKWMTHGFGILFQRPWAWAAPRRWQWRPTSSSA
jgi:CNT family concentrative nucleoside transporter